jgi:hypothetical protein
MPNDDREQPTKLRPWVLPLAIASVLLVVLGVVATYIDVVIGAVIVLVGMIGVWIVGFAASRAVDRDERRD